MTQENNDQTEQTTTPKKSKGVPVLSNVFNLLRGIGTGADWTATTIATAALASPILIAFALANNLDSPIGVDHMPTWTFGFGMLVFAGISGKTLLSNFAEYTKVSTMSATKGGSQFTNLSVRTWVDFAIIPMGVLALTAGLVGSAGNLIASQAPDIANSGAVSTLFNGIGLAHDAVKSVFDFGWGLVNEAVPGMNAIEDAGVERGINPFANAYDYAAAEWGEVGATSGEKVNGILSIILGMPAIQLIQSKLLQTSSSSVKLR